MRSADVTALSHRDENVSRMLSIMGGLYACQNPQVLRKALMAAELKKPDPSSFSSVLLSTLLLAVIELVLCAEDGAFQKWLQRISSYIAQHLEAKTYAGLTTFERSLIRFFNFLNTLSAIALNEEPLDRQMDFELSSSRPIAPRTISDEDEIDDMLSSLKQWARLQSSYREAIDLKVQGLDIICEASALQARVINDLLRLSEEPDSQVSICITPYYHWTLTGLSHRLYHEAWKTLKCELPVLPAESLHQQALVTLSCVETLASQSGFDVALYLPFADFIGREMETPTEQTRVLAFLEIVRSRGFGLANEYRKGLLETWGAATPAEMSQNLLICDPSRGGPETSGRD
ncbi:hypothetical protein CCUS01_10326 [Colletotrichum cuscutae]|uniref:Uncharacterized protein n=1 Tax=Colletotrichum cuscutae TaxID=1209917 RepID=A0AAI9XQ24_9PEZI|nr:hypothetical protein CCUS01_10326 [Colletotrichum cuscutae]